MCFTIEAHNERKWSGYPALRKILGGKNIPACQDELSSASDNMFDALSRLLYLVVIVRECKEQLIDNSQSSESNEILNELDNLKREVDSVRWELTNSIQDIDQIFAIIERERILLDK